MKIPAIRAALGALLLALPIPATAEDGPTGIGFVQAEEGTWWCRDLDPGKAFACAAQNWAFRRNTLVERSLFVIAGLLLVFPGLFEWMFTALAGVSIPQPGLIGLAIAIAAVFMQKFGPSAPTASAQH